MRPLTTLLCAALCLLAPRLAPAQEVEDLGDDHWVMTLVNGDRLRCRVLRETAEAVTIRWVLQPEAVVTVPRARIAELVDLDPPPRPFSWVLSLRKGDILHVEVAEVTAGKLRFHWEVNPEPVYEVKQSEVLNLRFDDAEARPPEWSLSLAGGERFTGRLVKLGEDEVRFRFEPMGEVRFARRDFDTLKPLKGPVSRAWSEPPARDKRLLEARAPTLEPLWEQLLEEDGEDTWRAYHDLAQYGARTTAFLRARLLPLPDDAGRIEALIRDLDSADWHVREAATVGLSDLGEAVVPAIKRALRGQPSPEAHWRLDYVRFEAEGVPAASSQQIRRVLRALFILEHTGGEDAQALVREVARQAAPGPVANLARDICDRLDAIAAQQQD